MRSLNFNKLRYFRGKGNAGMYKKNNKLRAVYPKGVRAAVFLCFISAVLSALLCGGEVYATDEPEITDTSCVYLYNISNDVVMYSKNAELSVYPASTVKIMFAVIAIEQWTKDWDYEITVTAEMLRDISGNNINLRRDEVVTFRDMINGVIVGGANDCCSVLAYAICGGTENFVGLMNQKANELGMYDTVYTNVTGMHDPKMRTTLSDTVKLSKYALVQYKYYDIASQYRYIMPATNKSGVRNIYTKNSFMTSYYGDKYYSPDVKGINAGATEEAGYCAVVTAEHEGTSYLAIAMGAGYDDENIYSFVTIRSLLDWAYENFGYVTIAKDSDIIREVPVNMASGTDKVALYPKNTVEVFMQTGIDVQNDIRKTVVLNSDELDAPLNKGDAVGFLTLSYNDRVLGKVELVVRNDVPRSEALYILTIAKTLLFSDYSVVIMAVIALAAIIYIIFRATSSEKKRSEQTAESIKKIYEPSAEQLAYSVKTDKTVKKDKQAEPGTQSLPRKELKKKDTHPDINIESDGNQPKK